MKYNNNSLPKIQQLLLLLLLLFGEATGQNAQNKQETIAYTFKEHSSRNSSKIKNRKK